MAINFKEIPEANSGSDNQDTFEKFSRDFFQLMGYEIVQEPGRGADGGIDVKVLEIRKVNRVEQKMPWLVSCKHYAVSGKSINPTIEHDIVDRVISKECNGFIGFYSTIATSGLISKLQGLNSMIEYQIFDDKKIEAHIVGVAKFEELFLRYFPQSYRIWKENYYYLEPVKLLEAYLDTSIELKNIKSIFKHIFKTTGNMIKCIRKFETWREAVEINDYMIWDDQNRLSPEIASQHGLELNINWFKDPNMNGIIDGHWDYTENKKSCTLWRQHMVVNKEYDMYLSGKYEEIKGMLG